MTRNADGGNNRDESEGGGISASKFYEMENRISLLEREVDRLNNSYTTIISKLDNLSREIVTQIRSMMETEFKLHIASCPLPAAIKEQLQDKKEKDKEEGGVQNWVIKNLVAVVAMLVAIIAAAMGIK